MKKNVLTKEERDVIILAGIHNINCKLGYLSYSEIAQGLGISVSRVGKLTHNSFQKLEVRNRIEAVHCVKRRGQISLKEFYSLDELVEIFTSVGPDNMRQIAHFLRHGLRYKHLTKDEKQVLNTGRKQDTELTKREREVICCAGRGLTNKEIAEKLFISSRSVSTFLYRACRKLEATNRTDAFMTALKQKEIALGDYCSVNELLSLLAPLGPEFIEKMACLMEEKLKQESIPSDKSIDIPICLIQPEI